MEKEPGSIWEWIKLYNPVEKRMQKVGVMVGVPIEGQNGEKLYNADYAICTGEFDVFNEELGKKIALGRALKARETRKASGCWKGSASPLQPSRSRKHLQRLLRTVSALLQGQAASAANRKFSLQKLKKSVDSLSASCYLASVSAEGCWRNPNRRGGRSWLARSLRMHRK